MENKFVIATKAIVRKKNKYLILHRSQTHPQNPNEADFPGGKLEFGEKMEDGLLREIREEANLEVSIICPVRSWSFFLNENTQITGMTYLVDYLSGEVRLSYEHSKFQWLSLEEILKNANFPEWIRKDFRAMQENHC